MARKPEQLLWDRFRRAMPGDIVMRRFENLLEGGTPDVIALAPNKKPGTARVTWIETKIAKWPKRAETRIQLNHPMTPEQINFHRVWTQRGGRSLILIGIDSQIFTVPGNKADIVNDIGQGPLLFGFVTDWKHLELTLRNDYWKA